jgi:hypothetical protein
MTFGWSQNKPKISIINNFDDSLSYYYYGITIFANYVNYYHIGRECKKHINDYIIKYLANKFDFVEIPSNIDKKLIKPPGFFSSKISKNGKYLMDSLLNNHIDYIIRIDNHISSHPVDNLQYSGWGIFARPGYSFFYSSFEISILFVNEGKYKFQTSNDPYSDFIKCEVIKPQKNRNIKLTVEELSQATDPIIKITDKILVGPIFQFLNLFQ